MNWLAHLALGGPDPVHRLGQLSGDFVRGSDIGRLAPRIRSGIMEHRAIDAFVDQEPAFRRLQALVPDSVRRFRAVIADVLLDHVLASRWERLMPEPFEGFIDRIDADLRQHRELLPERLDAVVEWMPDRLRSYREVDGIRDALELMSRRLRRPVRLETGAAVLESDGDAVHATFDVVWPRLTDFVAAHRAGLGPD